MLPTPVPTEIPAKFKEHYRAIVDFASRAQEAHKRGQIEIHVPVTDALKLVSAFTSILFHVIRRR